MARKSRMSMLKRQRELKKAEKAAQKRAKRHGIPEPTFSEPRPNAGFGLDDESDDTEDDAEDREESATPEDARV